MTPGSRCSLGSIRKGTAMWPLCVDHIPKVSFFTVTKLYILFLQNMFSHNRSLFYKIMVKPRYCTYLGFFVFNFLYRIYGKLFIAYQLASFKLFFKTVFFFHCLTSLTFILFFIFYISGSVLVLLHLMMAVPFSAHPLTVRSINHSKSALIQMTSSGLNAWIGAVWKERPVRAASAVVSASTHLRVIWAVSV